LFVNEYQKGLSPQRKGAGDLILINTFKAALSVGGYIMADVDFDGAVTVEDSRLVLRYAVDLEAPTPLQFVLADIDYSDTITVEDARKILRIASGLE